MSGSFWTTLKSGHSRNRYQVYATGRWHGNEGLHLAFGKWTVRLRTILVIFFVATLSACLDAPVEDVPDESIGADNDAGTGAPGIAGSPTNSVKVGEEFSFMPQASDPDGDPLSFSISNKPNWADFDNSTGELSGTPLLGNEGMYENIRITASDGTYKATIEFDLAVTTIGSASVTLSWTPPTQNDDGSTLNDLAGYKIYYGSAPGQYEEQLRVDNPSISTYVVGDLSPTTYYFAATAYNSRGLESDFTNEIAVLATE